jgi:PEP-CTERM motif
MKRFVYFASLFLILPAAMSAGIVENFDDVSTLPGSGWVMTNNSSPAGTTGWFQGNTSIFVAQAGPDDSYIAANFNNAAFGGDISNWLISPEFDLTPGNWVTFYTRTEDMAPFPDALEVRLSTNGSSSFVGGTSSSVGDFTTLLLAINPSLVVGGYPELWTQYSVLVPAFAGTGRVAFRYDVTDTSINGDYIGIDTFVQTPVPEPMTLMMLGTGIAGIAARRLKKNRA